VRIHFQQRPWDLYILIGYTLGMSFVLLVAEVGNFAAILLVLFVPGYAIVAALFPGKREIDWIERIALSVGLSIAVVPLLGLLLNFSPWGIRFAPIVVTIAAFTTPVGLLAFWRRNRLPEDERLSATLELNVAGWKDQTLIDKVLTVALVASIIVAAVSLAYVIATPRPGEAFTEFYILGPGGNASGYPTNLTSGQPGTVIVGIINHEAARVNYSTRIDLVQINIVYNSTCNCNTTVEGNRTTMAWLNQSIDNGQNWSRQYSFTINATGKWKVQFLLFRDNNLTSAYRELHLFIRVS